MSASKQKGGIKCLKPSKKSRYKQGYVNPDSLKKLFESQKNEPVIYRSSYERKFIQWLERSPKVVGWGSECICINYVGADGANHHYYPDYLVEFTDGRKVVFEIKPYNQTVRPDRSNQWACSEYSKNVRKWKAAAEFCSRNGIEFQIITEKTIERL